MGIDHSSLDALMPEQLLDLPEVDALHQKVGGEAVAEGMDGSVLHNAGLFNCFPYGTLDALVADMVASDLAAPRVHRQIGRRKTIFPFPSFFSIRIFSGKGDREIYFTMPGRQVLVVQFLYLFYVEPERLFDRLGKNGRSVLVSFAGPHNEQIAPEVDIQNPQTGEFHDRQA